jgi:hypothetical protein
MQSQDIPILTFRSPPLDSDSVTDSSAASTITSVTATTTYSSRIPPGIGALSGGFIQGIGKTILHGVEIVTVIRRRLAYIESICPLSDDTTLENVVVIYDDLLELARCDKSSY